MRRIVVSCVVICAVLSASAWPGAHSKRKVIGEGWDLSGSSPEELVENAAHFENCGVDGVTIPLWGYTPRGVYKPMLGDPVWKMEEILPRVAALKRLRQLPGLRESMLSYMLSPRTRLAWTDDAAWAHASRIFGELGRLARLSGIVGYSIDPEDYNLSAQYDYNPEKDRVSYDEAWRLARKRGAEFFGALFAEDDDPVLLSFWFFTFDECYCASDDPKLVAKSRGDLWPAFLNGMLDVLPPKARIVDGNEHVYWSESHRRDYYFKAHFPYSDVLGLVEPENRAKYKAQVEMSCGFYLDHYTNMIGKEKKADDPTRGLKPLEHFNRNLQQGAFAVSEYLWVNGERLCWIPWKRSPKSYIWKQKRFSEKLERPDGGTWESQLPGLTDMLNAIRDPAAYYRALPPGAAKELVANGACHGDAKGGISAPFTPFVNRAVASNVVICVDTSDGDGDKTCFAVRNANARGGMVFLDVSVETCGLYRVSLSAKGPTCGVICRICWKRGAAFDWTLPQPQIAFSEPDAKGWRRGETMVFVPEGIDRITLQAGAGTQPPDQVDIRFDNFSVKKVL